MQDSLQKELSDESDALENVATTDTVLFKELPLGYGELFTFKFPKKWEMGSSEKDEDNNPKNDNYGNRYDNFLVNKVQYYYSENYFSLPSCSNIIDTSLAGKDRDKIQIIKNIKFRLPDFKHYKIYFSYMLRPYDVSFAEYGTLVVYDVKMKRIQFVDIYVNEAKFAYAIQQYFYIEKDYTIKLRSFACDELYEYSEEKIISLDKITSAWK